MRQRSKKKRTTDSLERTWSRVAQEINPVLAPVRSAADLARKNELLDGLLEKVGDDEDHPLAALCDIVGRLIEEYEEKTVKMKDSSPVDVLKFLIEQHALKQSDLSEIISQSNLSAVLREKRSLTPKQIAQLGVRFHVSPALFIPGVESSKSKRRAA